MEMKYFLYFVVQSTTMSERDIKNLMDLADEQLKKAVTREEAIHELMDAGILDKNGNHTEPYQNLARALTPIRK